MEKFHSSIIIGTVLMNFVAIHEFATISIKGSVFVRLGDFGSTVQKSYKNPMSFVSNFFRD